MIDIPDIEIDISLTESRIKALQHQTIECVSISPAGKVTVTDKPRLESLNADIDRLAALAVGNKTVLARLREIVGGSLADILRQQRSIEAHIGRVEGCLSSDLGQLLQTHPGLDLESLQGHPKAQKIQADANAIISREQPALERLNGLVAEAEEILQDFQPSGLKPGQAAYTPFVGGF